MGRVLQIIQNIHHIHKKWLSLAYLTRLYLDTHIKGAEFVSKKCAHLYSNFQAINIDLGLVVAYNWIQKLSWSSLDRYWCSYLLPYTEQYTYI